MINYAVDSINAEIRKQLEQFVKLLSAGEARALAVQGANIYRGVVVKEDSDPFASEYFDKQHNEGVKMYRGVPVASSDTAKKVPMESAAEEKPAAKKGKRVYRGRVIED